jgi:hypothetical protein
MPKIASQTIEATLRTFSFPHPIYRFHYLSNTMANNVRASLATSGPANPWKAQALQHLNFVREIARWVRFRRILTLCGVPTPKLEVITAVRDLIGLILSSIFENHLRLVASPEQLTMDKCRAALLGPKMFSTLLDWFDLELKAFCGVDVYKTPFPRTRGWNIYENRFARVLLYRFEALHGLPDVLRQFLGHEIPALVNRNVGSSKPYAEQYGSIKERLKLPSDFVASLYNGKMMRHFYSDEERRHLQNKWAENPVGEMTQALH